MKNVLIISYLFSPENTIGAIRATKIAKYLSKRNIEVSVITTSNKDNIDSLLYKDIENVKNIIELDHSLRFLKIYNKIINKANENINSNDTKSKVEAEIKRKPLKKYISKFIRQSLLIYRSLDFVKEFKKYVMQKPSLINKYNIMFSTYGPTASLLCALWLKKYNPKMKWICDFRDPMTNQEMPNIFKIYNKFIQNRACKNADYIIAVSSGYLDRICKNKYQNKCIVITNGYDVDDIPVNGLQLTGKFSFIYPGSLYEGKRRITPLFNILKELIQENILDKKDLEFRYAGSEFKYLYNQASMNNLEDILTDHGSLSRKNCIELQYKSRFLILCSWNNKGEEGVIPGKLLEYMLFRKPIIALIEGNKKNSEVYNIINNANLGIAYEQIQEDIHCKMLKDYIIHEYKRYKNGLNATFIPKEDTVDLYSYEKITDKIISIMKWMNSKNENNTYNS